MSRRMTIGTLDEGSSINPLISTWSSSLGSLMPYSGRVARRQVKGRVQEAR